MNLPEEFINEIKEMTGFDVDAYLNAFSKPAVHSLRFNTLKVHEEEYNSVTSGLLNQVPWCASGYYFEEGLRPGTDPNYYAGLYYLQEASAMTPAAILPVKEGDMVLDACAAPGGKSTALACKLNGTGLLVSNDISASRQNATLKNLERAGVTNAYVISENINALASRYPQTFDAILTDVPCSGEGMFRRDPSLIASWLDKGPSYYAPIQKEILHSAWKMLRPGGVLVYSTCTFSVKENEEVVLDLMNTNNDVVVLPIENKDIGFMPGILPGLENCIRLYPHKVAGEGHFCALLQKKYDSNPITYKQESHQTGALPESVRTFLKHIKKELPQERIILQKEKVLFLPEKQIDTDGLRVMRSGLLLGTLKNDRFTPSQHLAFALRDQDFDAVIHLKHDDIRTDKYLRGETIEADEPVEGTVLVCCERWPLGFGRKKGRTIKNDIGKGYRKI